MRKKIILLLILFVGLTNIYATGFEIYATTDDGDRVILFPDYTFEFVEDSDPNGKFYGNYVMGEDAIDLSLKLAILTGEGITPDDEDFYSTFVTYKAICNLVGAESLIGENLFSLKIDKDNFLCHIYEEDYNIPYYFEDNKLYLCLQEFDETLKEPVYFGCFSDSGNILNIDMSQFYEDEEKEIIQKYPEFRYIPLEKEKH